MTDADRAPDTEAAGNYQLQARKFLAESREYLAAGKLHKASAKGWDAAANMAQAVAAAQGWEYDKHRGFSVVVNRASAMTGNDHLRDLRAIANDLRDYYYVRKRHLDAVVIGKDLESVAELLEILAPLIGGGE